MSKAPIIYDSHIHFRAESDLMPKVHKLARKKGMTSSSWLRSIIISALNDEMPKKNKASSS